MSGASPDGPEPDSSRKGALVGLVIVVVLVAVVILVVNRLGDASRLQDCVSSGRSNCAPIAAPPR
jgi:hypothetical protein